MNITNRQLQCCCSSRIRQFHRAELHYIFAHGNLLCTGNIPPPWVLLLKQISWGKKNKKIRGWNGKKLPAWGECKHIPTEHWTQDCRKAPAAPVLESHGQPEPTPSHPLGQSPCHATRARFSAQKRCGQPQTFWGWMFPHKAAGPSQPRCQSYLINHK